MFGNLRYRLRIKGIMPERALLRLKRSKIPLFDIKKVDETTLLFTARKKDLEKIFTIYPPVCYNEGEQPPFASPYRVEKIGEVGFAKVVAFCQNRVGFLLGILLFCAITLFADGLLFSVEFKGTAVYARETAQILEEQGVRLFRPYKKGREDIITARILATPDVEFCSVKKVGNRLVVEIRRSPFHTNSLQKGSMVATRSGKVLSMSVLRGTPLKEKGELVQSGEPLVGDFFEIDGEKKTVEPMARVVLACEFEKEYALGAEEAFANAYLELNLQESGKITAKELTETATGTKVKISYTVVETRNM